MTLTDELQAIYAQAAERVVRDTTRAYGVAFTGWMTGHPLVDMGSGPRPEQHARISEHYRRALTDGIESAVDQQLQARIRARAFAPQSVSPDAPARQQVAAQARARAQKQFLRGQYRVHGLFFETFLDLERDRQCGTVQACLHGVEGGNA